MRFIKTYIVRPFSVIIPLYLCFSFIAGSLYANEWGVITRSFYMLVLFFVFIITEKDKPTI